MIPTTKYSQCSGDVFPLSFFPGNCAVRIYISSSYNGKLTLWTKEIDYKQMQVWIVPRLELSYTSGFLFCSCQPT